MLSECGSNEDFRQDMKKTGLFTRMIGAILKFFGVDTAGAKKTDMYKEVHDRLVFLIENFNEHAWRETYKGTEVQEYQKMDAQKRGEDDGFPYGNRERDKGDHYSIEIDANFDDSKIPSLELPEDEFSVVCSSIDSNHKKDKNFSLNTAYSGNNGYFYIRKENNIRFVGKFDAAKRPIVEHNLKELSNGTIKDGTSISDIIAKHQGSARMASEFTSVFAGRRSSNGRPGSVDTLQEANISGRDRDMVGGLSYMEKQSDRDRRYIKAVNAGDGVEADNIIKELAIESMPNTKVVNKKGEPMIVYHGTPNEGFTIFDRDKSGSTSGDKGLFGEGFYFNDNERYVKMFAEAKGGEGRVIRAYINIEKPFIPEEHTKEEIGKLLGVGDTDVDLYSDPVTYLKVMSAGHEREFVENLKKAGYDGVITKEYEPRQIVAFESNQIKSADIEYNDVGALILPSERFKGYNRDIRYRTADASVMGQKKESSALVNNAALEAVNALGGGFVHTNRKNLPTRARVELAKNPDAMGYYDPMTGEVHIFAFNCPTRYEAEKTVMHEKVAHEGLSKVVSDTFRDEYSRQGCLPGISYRCQR